MTTAPDVDNDPDGADAFAGLEVIAWDDGAPRIERVATAARERVGWIDGARGLSIVAMIVSHLGLITGLTAGWFHLYVMRPVAPMFLLLLGMLWRPGFRRRHVQFIAAAIASALLAAYIGFAVPNILTVMAMCLLAMPIAVRWPVGALVLCVLQVTFWPMPAWWTGYQPGFALLLVLVGQLLPADGYLRAYGRLGSWLGFEAVGRRPITWYVGHLVALALVAGPA